jgi:zinc/manganese transport system substrate-binding protein
VERALSKLDPSHKADFAKRSRELQNEYRELGNWVRVELTKVPQSRRRLVTAHAAFGYFCKAYDFESSSILGLSGDHEIPAQELLTELKKVRSEGVRAVFPEQQTNPKVLAQVAAEAGAKLGQPLVADGAVASYDQMMRANVSAIVAGLGAGKETP